MVAERGGGHTGGRVGYLSIHFVARVDATTLALPLPSPLNQLQKLGHNVWFAAAWPHRVGLRTGEIFNDNLFVFAKCL
jgi:hypothetical protein